MGIVGFNPSLTKLWLCNEINQKKSTYVHASVPHVMDGIMVHVLSHDRHPVGQSPALGSAARGCPAPRTALTTVCYPGVMIGLPDECGGRLLKQRGYFIMPEPMSIPSCQVNILTNQRAEKAMPAPSCSTSEWSFNDLLVYSEVHNCILFGPTGGLR